MTTCLIHQEVKQLPIPDPAHLVQDVPAVVAPGAEQVGLHLGDFPSPLHSCFVELALAVRTLRQPSRAVVPLQRRLHFMHFVQDGGDNPF